MTQNELGRFTRKEILSQPEVWNTTLNNWSDVNIQSFPSVEDYQQALFIGCGSTYFLSRWAARLNESYTGVISRAAPSSEFLLHPDSWLKKDRPTLLVATSRSAATTETVKAIEVFKENYQGDVITITCNPEEKMGSQSPFLLAAPYAMEKSIAQTRSFSSMMLAHAFLIERGLPKNISEHMQKKAAALLDQYSEKISKIGNDASIQGFFFLGSGALYGLANECMLKMKEISLSYSESFHTMEFRHGPMSMVNHHTLVVGLLGDSNQDQELAVLKEMKAMGAHTIAIMESAPDNIEGIDDLIILDSELPLLWRSALYLPTMQWLAYKRGILNGMDPDNPNNLNAVVILDN